MSSKVSASASIHLSIWVLGLSLNIAVKASYGNIAVRDLGIMDCLVGSLLR